MSAPTRDDDTASWVAMPHERRIDELVKSERRIAAEQARQYRLLALLAADPPEPMIPAKADKEADKERDPDKQWLREEVACALRLAPGTAAARLDQAETLARVPRVLDQLAAGVITGQHARLFAEAVSALDDATAGRVADRVLVQAGEQSVGEFRRSLTRCVLALAPVEQEKAREVNVAERRIRTRPYGAGVSELWALLPDEDLSTVLAAISMLARSTSASDMRTRDQREADALSQLCADAIAGDLAGPRPSGRRLRPAIQVSVALSTLLSLDEQPGELAGIGPISASLARRLAADESGTWRRLVTDECGRLFDYGRTTYRPPTDLSDKVVARDRTCRFPHCSRPAGKASSTTASRGPTADPPARRTCTHSAPGTTISSTKLGGVTSPPMTGRSTGRAPPDIATRPRPAPTRSTGPLPCTRKIK